jgi:hypothetical protein
MAAAAAAVVIFDNSPKLISRIWRRHAACSCARAMHKILALTMALVSGCAGQLGSDDGAADEAALAGKADAVAAAATIAGIYQLSGDATAAGDVVYLWLLADGRFAWTRCYDADCATPVVEDGTYKLTTSSGKKYVTFYQSGAVGDAKTHFNSMYAYTATKKSLKLRPTRSSRWMTLAIAAESALCSASGGAWNGGCDCGAGWPTAYSPGAGGCWVAPATGESACDDTMGSWSDDDANLAGTFCDCGYARHLTVSGCVANRF